MNNSEVNIELKKYVEQRRDERHKYLMRNIYYGLFFGALLAVALFLLDYWLKNDLFLKIITVIFGTLMGFFGTFFFTEWKKIQDERDCGEFYVSKHIEESVSVLKESINCFSSKLKAGTIYSELIAQHLNLNWKLSNIFSCIVKDIDGKGGIVITATSHRYLELLEDALGQAKSSYEAILRGGNEQTYRPSWFFNKNKNSWDQDKLKFLKSVAKYEKFPRTRILIIDEMKLIEDFSVDYIRKQFLEKTTSGNQELFWGIPERLAAYVPLSDKKKIWEEDYAIIDDSLVLKHNSSDSLLFASTGTIDDYKVLFNVLAEDLKDGNSTRFRKLTENNIGNEEWTEWLNKNMKNKSSDKSQKKVK